MVSPISTDTSKIAGLMQTVLSVNSGLQGVSSDTQKVSDVSSVKKDNKKDEEAVVVSMSDASKQSVSASASASSVSNVSSLTSSGSSDSEEDANYDEDMDYNGDGKVTIDERIKYFSEQYQSMSANNTANSSSFSAKLQNAYNPTGSEYTSNLAFYV